MHLDSFQRKCITVMLKNSCNWMWRCFNCKAKNFTNCFYIHKHWNILTQFITCIWPTLSLCYRFAAMFSFPNTCFHLAGQLRLLGLISWVQAKPKIKLVFKVWHLTLIIKLIIKLMENSSSLDKDIFLLVPLSHFLSQNFAVYLSQSLASIGQYIVGLKIYI